MLLSYYGPTIRLTYESWGSSWHPLLHTSLLFCSWRSPHVLQFGHLLLLWSPCSPHGTHNQYIEYTFICTAYSMYFKKSRNLFSYASKYHQCIFIAFPYNEKICMFKYTQHTLAITKSYKLVQILRLIQPYLDVSLLFWMPT